MGPRRRVTAAAMLCACMTVSTLLAGPATGAPVTDPPPADPVATARNTYTAATDTLTAALTSAADARVRVKTATAEVRSATAEELTANAKAFEAVKSLRALARQQYISGSGAEMATVAKVVTDGPAALTDLSRAEVVTRHVETASADDANATIDAAADASARTRNAITAYTKAADEVTAADAAIVAARGDLAAADTAYTQARARAACDTGTVGDITNPDSGRKIADLLRAQNFSAEAIAAVLGNLQQESSVDPRKLQGGGGIGRGLAQWSTGGRWDTGKPDEQLLGFAAARHLDPWSIDAQTAFMVAEMTGGWGGFNLADFKTSTDVVDATIYMHDTYERSADSADFVRTVRGGYAKKWFVLLNGGDPATCGTTSAAPPAGLNVTLPVGWTSWSVPGGNDKIHPDARRVAQYTHASAPEVTAMLGWRDGPRDDHSTGLAIDIDAPAPAAARLAAFYATYASSFGIETVSYNGRAFTAGRTAVGTPADAWPAAAPVAGEPGTPTHLHIVVWGNRNPRGNAPTGLWVGR